MDLTWDALLQASGGHSVGGQVIALMPGEGNVKLAERSGKTFTLTSRGEQFVRDMEAAAEAAKSEAAKQAAEAAAAEAAKSEAGAQPPAPSKPADPAKK